MGIKIVSSGKAIPKKKISNNDFKKIETSDEWIYSRTGIKNRHFVTNENTSDLAYQAALNAITKADIDRSKIKVVIVATMTPDSFTPAVASKILSKLGIRAMAFDVNVACSGFVYALNIADKLVTQGDYALVIGAECLSKLLDFKERASCVLFGDGAGAVILEKSDNKALFYSQSKTDEDNILEAKGLSTIKTGKTLKNFKLQMKGQEVFKFALEAIKDCFDNLADKGVNLSDVDLIIPHQANKRIIQSVAKKSGIAEERFYLNLEKYGNTSAASIAIALDEAYESGKLKSGNKILLVGFGSGLSWGYCYLEI